MVVIVGKTVSGYRIGTHHGPCGRCAPYIIQMYEKIRMQMPPYAKNIIPAPKRLATADIAHAPVVPPARNAPHGMPGNIRRQKKTTGMAHNVIFCIFAQI